MISAKGLVYGGRNTLELLATSPQDTPLVVQLYGSEPQIIVQAMRILLDQGYVYFDLNCGCSVKKVVKTGSGAALLKNPELLLDIALAMIDASGPERTGIKIRLGWNKNQEAYLRLAAKLEHSGIGWITLHPRTAVQMFTGSADWTALKILKQSTNIPIVASGDLYTAQDAVNCLSLTGVDNIMFARGALNNPSIFADYLTLKNGMDHPWPDRNHLRELCLKTIDYYARYCPSPKAVLKMRTILPRMIRDMPGAKELRKEIIMCKEWDAVLKAVEKI